VECTLVVSPHFTHSLGGGTPHTQRYRRREEVPSGPGDQVDTPVWEGEGWGGGGARTPSTKGGLGPPPRPLPSLLGEEIRGAVDPPPLPTLEVGACIQACPPPGLRADSEGTTVEQSPPPGGFCIKDLGKETKGCGVGGR